ncbi:MAG: hypothetical protein D6780_05870 [Candidatus Dadabacteria bacterium]|nr:MAG: hypothetical protein D6780_05870 [Candidatus Dadabacteria bacterium]
MGKASELLSATAVKEIKKESDTIKLWEGYKEQALFWRAISLMQFPVTIIVSILAMWIWSTRSITLHVPARPLPGTYAINEIPPVVFAETAQDFLNLIATYQPTTAARQFKEAAKYTFEPFTSVFVKDYLHTQLGIIADTDKTQIFFPDPTKTMLRRSRENVEVIFAGSRRTSFAGSPLPTTTTIYRITLKTIPRNTLNKYGIVVVGASYHDTQYIDVEMRKFRKEGFKNI